MNFDPSPYLLLYTLTCAGDNETNKHFSFFNIVQRILVTTNRFYSDTVKYPKITTHYTVHPRESDPRWKGEIKFTKIETERQCNELVTRMCS